MEQKKVDDFDDCIMEVCQGGQRTGKEKNPKISVLMPIYNTDEKYLREAIESILNQSFKDYEFLILNDSPDNIKLDKIIASYKDKRIKYSKNDKNIGITRSRNKLIDMAIGEYLAVMDHDDISLPERFTKEVEYLDAHPKVGVVGCKTQRMSNNKMSKNPTEDKDIRLALMRSCCITHPASMIRKSVLIENKIRYEEQFSPSEDYALWCRLIKCTRFYNVPELLFRYRDHEENTSHKQKNKMDMATLAIQSFVEAENPALHSEFLLRATHTTRIRLFGFIPLLTIFKKGYRTKIYLFEKIPLFTTKSDIKSQEK